MQRKIFPPSIRKKRNSKLPLPDFGYEKNLWKKGFSAIGGIDEVGRGSFAGPVVAGCVVFSKKLSDLKAIKNSGVVINDSKKLTPGAREKADKWIRENALTWGIGEASVSAINRLGIKKATETAFRRAIKYADKKGTDIDFLLIDAFYIPYVKGLRRKNQKAIIKGDAKSISIAAASIIAKVYRDKLMVKLSKDRKYKKYGWEKNKGYGTKDHREAIKTYGTTKLHRRDFVRGVVK